MLNYNLLLSTFTLERYGPYEYTFVRIEGFYLHENYYSCLIIGARFTTRALLHKNYYSCFIFILKPPSNTLVVLWVCIDFYLSYTLIEWFITL